MTVLLVLHTPEIPLDIVRDVEARHRQIVDADVFVRCNVSPTSVADCIQDGMYQRMGMIFTERSDERREEIAELQDEGVTVHQLVTVILDPILDPILKLQLNTHTELFGECHLILHDQVQRGKAVLSGYFYARVAYAEVPDPYAVLEQI